MTDKVGGVKFVPVIGAFGLLLLLGVLAIVYRVAPLANFSGGAESSNTGLSALLTAQATIRAAQDALTNDSPAAFEGLAVAAERLDSVDPSELRLDQIQGLRDLGDVIDTVENGRDVQQVLAVAISGMQTLLPQLEIRSSELAEANTFQSKAVVNAQLRRLSLLGKSVGHDFQVLQSGSSRPGEVTLQLLESDMAIAQITNGFRRGDPELGLREVTDAQSRNSLAGLEATSTAINGHVKNVLGYAKKFEILAQARRQLSELASQLSPEEMAVSGAVTEGGSDSQRQILTGVIGLVMCIILFMIWNFYRSSDMRKSVTLQAQQSERNQAAIIRLLDELGSLADGDLTVKATVTEDITGAIADSINYAIEALRDLVVTLNESAIMVDGAAKQTDGTAQQLAEASHAQSMQIEAASQAIASLIESGEEISGNAERSSDVARHSVDVAHKGGDAVRRTIAGMNTIRETIQETAKRIKRLGESSQEIGDIVELINDIADQTNILALNASIQASMAGEAGRGFAVVADEVQRLAERSANATKQIEVLVRTIQSDTNEAIVSMERSTTDVVGGALLAENAGAALEEIEQVSNQIASLVQNISGSAREQVSSAATVTHNVDRLQEINSETAASTSATTESIRKLAELSAQLRESVSGFRLPDIESGNQGVDDRQNEGEENEYFIDPSVIPESEDIQFADQKTA
jgi:twitching motility protein PilJ